MLNMLKSKQESYNLSKDKEQINQNIEDINKKHEAKIKSNFGYAEDVVKSAYKNGVTFDVSQDSKGLPVYKAKGEDPIAVAKYQKLANNIRQKELDVRTDYTAQMKVESDRFKNWVKANQENSKIVDIARREDDLASILINDFETATKNIGYSLPALFGSKQAINMYGSSQSAKEAYEAAIDWNTATATGQKGRYGLISINQQLPNILLATATAGTGSA